MICSMTSLGSSFNVYTTINFVLIFIVLPIEQLTKQKDVIDTQQITLDEMANKLEKQNITISDQKDTVDHIQKSLESQLSDMHASMQLELKDKDMIIDTMSHQLTEVQLKHEESEKIIKTSHKNNVSKIKQLETTIAEKNSELEALQVELRINNTKFETLLKYKNETDMSNRQKVIQMEQKIAKLKQSKLSLKSQSNLTQNALKQLNESRLSAAGYSYSAFKGGHNNPSRTRICRKDGTKSTPLSPEKTHSLRGTNPAFLIDNTPTLLGIKNANANQEMEMIALKQRLGVVEGELLHFKNENQMLKEKVQLSKDIANGYDQEIQMLLSRNKELSQKQQTQSGLSV